jgi:hypothetical protein
LCTSVSAGIPHTAAGFLIVAKVPTGVDGPAVPGIYFYTDVSTIDGIPAFADVPSVPGFQHNREQIRNFTF